MDVQKQDVFGQASWVIETDEVSLAVTERGGMMAPVTFFRSSGTPFSPYYINPWHDEKLDIADPVLRTLRGDFFCMPFGAGGEYEGVSYVSHGEPATERWTLESGGTEEQAGSGDAGFREIRLSLETRAPAASITKRLMLRPGENAVYQQHRIRGKAGGRTPLAHHATLQGGGSPERLLISTSRHQFGLTESRDATHFSDGEYYSLQPSTRFEDPGAVPTIWKDQPNTDCTVFPNRHGFVDVLGIALDPSVRPAWTAAVDTEAQTLWYSLKDPLVLPTTVFWMENYGRHQPPWKGRNSCIGLEDICGSLAEGMGPSLGENALSRAGVPTAHELDPDREILVNVIHGALRLPAGFGHVTSVEFTRDGLVFADAAGRSAGTSVQHAFVESGEL